MALILALSDTHIGAGYEHRKDALADASAVLDQIANLAIDRHVGLVLHAGDVFHRAKPAPAELHVFKRFVDRLGAEGIPMVAIGGNGLHEAPAEQKSALELFESPLVRVSRKPEVLSFSPTAAFSNPGVTVCTLPAVSLGRLAAEQGSSDRADLAEQTVDLLLDDARRLFTEAPDDRPRILLAHQMVSGASLPNGLPLEALGAVLPLWALEEIGYDAIVLGDIHKSQVLPPNSGAWTFYCGSPMTMDFGETNERHGVWLAEFTDGEPTEYDFVPLTDRRFVTVDVDFQESAGARSAESAPGADGLPLDEVDRSVQDSQPLLLDETDLIAAAISERFPLTDAVVRVRYRASEEQHRRVDHAALNRLLVDAGAHRVFGGIQWQPIRESRARAKGMDETLEPLAALNLWLEAQSMNGSEGAALKALVRGYLEAS